MEQKMENNMETLCLFERVITPIQESNGKEKDNYMEAGVMQGFQGLEQRVYGEG